MSRFGTHMRRFSPVIVLVAVLALLAGGLPALVASPGGSGGGLSIQAPGSSGSVHSLPWWDPRGWFGSGGSGAPSTRVLDDNAVAVPQAGRMPRQAKAAPVRRVRELTAKRDEYSRVYQLSDGQQQAVISSGPVNYKDPAGKWTPISTTVRRSSVSGYAFQNATNIFRSYFGSSAGQLIRFDAPGGGWLAMGLAGARVGTPRVAGDTVTYADVAPGVSLSYQVTAQSLTERITLASPAAAASLASLHFVIKTGGGLVPQARRDGSVTLSRGALPVLTLPAPFMTDARPVASSPYGFAWSPRVLQHAAWDAATRTLGLSLSADTSWLNAAARRFPVVVDPTIDISPTPTDAQNVMIEQDTPTTNYSDLYRLSVGTTGTTGAGAVRSLLSFPLGAVPSGTQLSSADLNLYYDQTFGPGTADQTVEVHQATAAWQASTATWNNANSNVGQLGNNRVTVDDSDTADTSASGAWPSAVVSGAVSGEYRYDQDTTAGDTFTWVPQVTESGAYQVQAHYVASSTAASNAPYTVTYNGGSHAYTVNQQSGTGGVWTTLGTQNFAAGNTGKVVLGDGPATASVRVEADAVRLTMSASVVADPNVANVWDSFSVRNIVQSWLSGSSANDGFVVKPSDESTLNVGGPRYEASINAYNGEVVTYPQLVLTYGTPGVTMNPITTIHATGAELSWTPYTNNTGDPGKDLAEYQVHRSVFQSFTPASNTLVAPVLAGTTSFTDTTNTPTPPGGLGNAFYYMVAVKTKDGTVIPGPVQLVRLPTAGSTIQIIHASGATSLSSAQPTTVEQHITGQPWVSVGDDSATFGTTRSVFSFPSMTSAGIPSDATVSEAHLKLWGFVNDTVAGATYDAYELTQSFTASQATWNNATTATAWTTAGGTFETPVLSQISGLTNDPDRHNWPVTSAVQDWVDTPADEHGLLVKLDSSAIAERELFLDTTAAEAALRPELVVTYTEPTSGDTYYAPSLPDPMSSSTSYTVPVTLTNTTSSTLSASDWVLSYHWLAPDGTDVSTSADQEQTALTASMAPSSVATINAAVMTPDTSTSGDARAGYQLAWDLFDKTTGIWLSSGTSTPGLSAVRATRLGGAHSAAASSAGAEAADMPMAQGNQTVPTLKQAASVEQPSSDLLGLEKFYQYTGVNTGSGTSLLNNADAGNVVWNYNAFSNPSRGFQTFVRLDYNSMDTSESSMGFGWSLQASSLMRLGTPLDFLPNPHPTTVKLTDGDGTGHLFTLNQTTGQWQSPPGVHYFLQQIADCTPNGKDPIAKAWLMTAPDRTQFWFDCQGYQTAVIDKNGNEADFTYTQKNSNNSPVKFLDYITDPVGRQTLTISYYNKGDNYQYVDDSTGNLVSATSLTNPDIIDMVKSITAIPQSATASPRTISFFYDTQGLMSQMTDGDGSSITKTFKFGYDATQGNKNVKLVSVTDPRGNTTNLAYYTAPQDPKFKWSLETITDRLQRATNFAYTEPAGGGIQTVVTDPKTSVSTYLMDTTGRPVQVTNAKNEVTRLAWDADNNVASLTEDNGAQTTWTHDPNTGYPLTMHDAQANHDGTAGTTYTYQTALSGHTAELISELTPQQRLWTFTYDTNGNLKTVTKPLGNVSGAPAGSYTTSYGYDPSGNGDLISSTDPLGNQTTYGSYDPTGYPGTVTVPTQDPAHPVLETTAYTYDATGNVTAVEDPLQNTTTQAYDVFGRPLKRVVPKTSTVSITTPAPVYDHNDNVTQSTAPNSAIATYAYDADDELASKVTPPDTSTSPSPTTTYTYDANGNLATQTAPDGNVSGATAGSYTTTYGYNLINELNSITDPANGLTKYSYNDVGNKTSVIDPDTHKTQYAYNLNHQVTQVTDAAGNTTKTGYDLDGNVDSATDQNNNTTLFTLDADAEVTQVQVPAQAPGAPVTYDTMQYVYDQDGNKTQVISPRGVASGITNAYTTQAKYTADNQVSAMLTPYLPGDPTYGTPAETDYSYDADGRLSSISAPPSGNSSTRNVTNYQYFDNGWTHDSTDPAGITTSYDYNKLGEQNSRILASPTGDLSRTMTWGYYPDGKLASVSDQGVPTGLYAEVTEASDPGAAGSPAGAWTTTQCGTTPGCEGPQYETHAAGLGTDKFTWHLYIPADGNYTVYVKYPVIPGAATNASYTVNHNGVTVTATADQTQNNNNGWVSLGKWMFTQAGKNQRISLAENSGGTVVADAVRIVRDNSGDTNTSNHTYAYTYDANGNQTGITDSSPGAAVNNYVMAYDQDNRNTSVTEQNIPPSGSPVTTVHTTSYGYDAASNLMSRTHDSAPSSYTYNNLNQLASESDAKSSADPSPQVSTFQYAPTGQVALETRPNSNTVTSTYYANGLPYQQTEKTSGGTLVSSHQYTYDPNSNTTQDVEQLMSADDSSGNTDLNHTLGYTYDPTDQVTTVTTDGTQTESYTHDADNNVTAQTVNGTQTGYNYDQGRLVTATTGGTTSDYNYDPFGRLDTVTAGSQTLQSNTYDGFDNLTSVSQWNTSTQSMNTTSYTYDSLNRMASQTTAAGTSTFAYLGMSSELASEQDPNSTSKTYDYTPGGMRLSQTTTASDGSTTPGYYSYNSHSDVEAVTGATGTTAATYGYTAYGSPVTSMFTGQDKNDATSSPTSTTQPYNSYRFNAMRWDSATGQYDMGFRNYDPGLNQFVSRDMYDGALADAGLTTDPFTGSRYAFGGGNPVTNIENDGHTPCDAGYCPTLRQTEQVTQRAEQDNPDVPVIRRFGSGISEAAAAPNEGTYERDLDAALAAFKHKYGYVPNDLNSCQANPGGGFPSCGGKDVLDVLHFLHDFLCKESGIICVGAVAGQSPLSTALRMGATSGLMFPGIGHAGEDEPGAAGICGGGESFTAGTKVLLASGKAVPIATLKPGDKVLATNTRTGKTQSETVTAVEVRHDTNLYDLTVKTAHGTAVVHTTSNHLFWDPYRHRWTPSNKLTKGEHLKSPDGTTVTVVSGTAPADHDGWMWDLTVPGNNDHDFYVLPSANDGHHAAHAVTGDTPILVHNACGDVYGPGNPGPLPDKVAETFTGGTYTETVTSGGTRLYRVYGGTAGKFGGYWSRTLPSSAAQAIRDSALDPAWGNTAEHWVSIDVPGGTTLYEGTAAAQGGLPGGGSQVLIQGGPDPAWESGGGSLP